MELKVVSDGGYKICITTEREGDGFVAWRVNTEHKSSFAHVGHQRN